MTADISCTHLTCATHQCTQHTRVHTTYMCAQTYKHTTQTNRRQTTPTWCISYFVYNSSAGCVAFSFHRSLALWHMPCTQLSLMTLGHKNVSH